MKKLLLLLTFVSTFTFTFTFAQTDKGWRSVGGTGQLTLDFKNKTESFNLAPEMYWFVGDNFALGTDFGFGFMNSTTTINDSLDIKNTTSILYGYITPGIKYFFGSTDHKWRTYAFLNGGLEFNSSNSKTTNMADQTSHGSGFKGYAGIGEQWFFNEHAAFDIRLHVIDFGLDNSLNPPKTDAQFHPTFSIGLQAYFHHE